MGFADQAQVLADTSELGYAAGTIYASAGRTGLDPLAIAGLTGVALALAGVAYMRENQRPYATDRELLDDTEALDVAIFRREHECAALRDTALSAAVSAAEGPDGDAIRADAQAALDVLAEVMPRLRYARLRLTAVPRDLAERYEAPQDLVRKGGVMPYAGRWITGERGRQARERLST